MNEQPVELRVSREQAGARLDVLVSQMTGLSRSYVQGLVQAGNIQHNGKPAEKKRIQLREGDSLQIVIPPPQEMQLVPQKMPLEICYEDEMILVVNKPKGLVVHPAPGHPDGTLVNGLLYHCGTHLSQAGDVFRPGIVHRIDKDTSGLLVVAKTDKAYEHLSGLFATHAIIRQYQAVVYGGFKQPEGRVDGAIGRSAADRKKMAVVEQGGRPAATLYRVLGSYTGFSHLSLELLTGRTHQIRVHMASIGHPVAGDPVYGPKKVIKSLNGQCLHAGKLGFTHPETGKEMRFESKLPPYFQQFVSTLKTKE